MAITPQLKNTNSLPVKRLFFQTLTTIFLIETAVMLILHSLVEPLHLTPFSEGIVDSVSLIFFMFPVLYMFFYRPLTLEIARHAQANKELSELNALNQTLIKTVPFGMDVVDAKGNVLYLSPKVEAIFGKEAIGKKCWSLYRDDKMQCGDCPLRKSIITGETSSIETSGILGGRSVEISHTCMEYQEKNVLLEIFQDITERKLAEEELLRLNRELLKLDYLKSEFINMSSHELRTPIAIVREGISQMVEGLHGELKPEQKYFLDKSFKNINRLIKIVDNIFEISELDSGKVGLENELFDLVELVRDAVSSMGRQIKGSGLEIKENFSGNRIELYADKKKISRVLTELIKNVLKFTEKGYIEIKIEDKDDGVEFSVKDSGRGIAEENLPKLFDKFQQFGRDFGSGERGTGLGLALAKGLIELHKGKIWVDSRLGEGSKFSFSLPKG